MSHRELADRVALTLGSLLPRSNREHLHSALTEDVPGVDATLYPVLSGLARTGPVTATQLAATIGLDRTVITRHASRLASAGLLARHEHPDDARATVLALTEAGHRTVTVLRAKLNDIVAEAMSDWSESEARTFTELFARLADALRAPAPTVSAPPVDRPQRRPASRRGGSAPARHRPTPGSP